MSVNSGNAVNKHAARDTSMLADYANVDNLGTALSRRYGGKLFSLAITTRKGDNKAIPAPPPDSLEALHATSDTSTFIGSRVLKRSGTCFSSVFEHTYRRANWANAFDGVVVLNVEYPAHSTRP
jgi:erythromycin esterase-like protein